MRLANDWAGTWLQNLIFAVVFFEVSSHRPVTASSLRGEQSPLRRFLPCRFSRLTYCSQGTSVSVLLARSPSCSAYAFLFQPITRADLEPVCVCLPSTAKWQEGISSSHLEWRGASLSSCHLAQKCLPLWDLSLCFQGRRDICIFAIIKSFCLARAF